MRPELQRELNAILFDRATPELQAEMRYLIDSLPVDGSSDPGDSPLHPSPLGEMVLEERVRAADLERELAHEQTLRRECYADAVGWLEQVDRILVACGLEPCGGASDERGKAQFADAILSVLSREQTLRREAEERVAELEAAASYIDDETPRTPEEGEADPRLAVLLQASANHRAQMNEVCPGCGEDWPNCTCEAAEPPPRCLAWMCAADAEPGEEVCARHGGEAPLRASVEAAERKRGGR